VKNVTSLMVISSGFQATCSLTEKYAYTGNLNFVPPVSPLAFSPFFSLPLLAFCCVVDRASILFYFFCFFSASLLVRTTERPSG